MSTERLDVAGVLARLERTRAEGRSGIAFDADGTLWSGDVGEDAFTFASKHGLFRDDAKDALALEARAHALSSAGPASEIARRLFDAYRRGEVGERRICEIMTWGYAGWSLEDLGAIARRAFEECGLVERRRANLDPVFRWARSQAIRVVVISASPHQVVTEALRLTGIDVDDLAAGRPTTDGERVLPQMAEAIPYAAQKAVLGARLLAGCDWLASFGDNVFDMEMLRAARLGVLVSPKPALLARLPELANAVLFE